MTKQKTDLRDGHLTLIERGFLPLYSGDLHACACIINHELLYKTSSWTLLTYIVGFFHLKFIQSVRLACMQLDE